MNAVERIEAAIAKLEALRAERGYLEDSGWLVEENPDDRGGFLEPPEPFIPITNDDLIVTLHRTIDAQLDILEAARRMKGVYREDDGRVVSNRFGHCALELAVAILGESA